jgi:hypothetical protein
MMMVMISDDDGEYDGDHAYNDNNDSNQPT